jgi:hypothetical protein
MPSHFSTIGLPVNDPNEFAKLADRIIPLATPIQTDRGTYWRWVSKCGAEVWLQVNPANELVGMVPYFSGNSKVRVRITARVSRDDDSVLDGAIHGWADPEPSMEDSGVFPFVFDLPDSATHSSLPLASIVEARIAAFCHEIGIYPSVEAYDASQTGDVRYASKSFIPSGLFMQDNSESANSPPAYAIFTGQVLAYELKKNSLTQDQYHWALVETLGGSFDVVIDPRLCEAVPVIGGVLSGSFWLCGRLVDKLTSKPGFFSKWFRRP